MKKQVVFNKDDIFEAITSYYERRLREVFQAEYVAVGGLPTFRIETKTDAHTNDITMTFEIHEAL